MIKWEGVFATFSFLKKKQGNTLTTIFNVTEYNVPKKNHFTSFYPLHYF